MLGGGFGEERVECMLELGGAEGRFDLTLMGQGYAARFLAYHYGDGIGSLCDAKGGAVSEAHRARNIGVVTYRQDTSGSRNAVMGYDHGTVVER